MCDEQLLDVPLDRWGVSVEAVLTRLQVSSFVSARHRYLYIMPPKIGCTTLKHMIAAVEDITFRPEVVARRNRDSKRGMLIHDQETLPVPHLTSLPPVQAAAVLHPDSGYLHLAFVRNPCSRLFLSWNNKLRFVEPSYAPVAAAIWATLGRGYEAEPVDFADFADFICRYEDSRLCDHHWATQTALLFPDAIQYSFVCPIEEFGLGWSRWRAHLERVRGESVEALTPPSNVSIPENWRLAYDQRLADRVYEYYSEDFRRLGYDRNIWQTADEVCCIQPTAMNSSSGVRSSSGTNNLTLPTPDLRNTPLLPHVNRPNRRSVDECMPPPSRKY